jgi:hypothetical protein
MHVIWMELYILEGPFYPPNLENSDWLRFYSQVFDYVEMDSTCSLQMTTRVHIIQHAALQ